MRWTTFLLVVSLIASGGWMAGSVAAEPGEDEDPRDPLPDLSTTQGFAHCWFGVSDTGSWYLACGDSRTCGLVYGENVCISGD